MGTLNGDESANLQNVVILLGFSYGTQDILIYVLALMPSKEVNYDMPF